MKANAFHKTKILFKDPIVSTISSIYSLYTIFLP